jgi:hypothetical protein
LNNAPSCLAPRKRLLLTDAVEKVADEASDPFR